jgi:hypothetical protein
LQDALLANDADVDHSDGKQDGEAERVISGIEGATIPEPQEPFDAQHRVVEDLSTIRVSPFVRDPCLNIHPGTFLTARH